MREIKFRAWDVKLKEMFPLEPKARKANLWELEGSEIWKVMQYTGLSDKNGKEIFEGDLLVYRDISGSGRPREFEPRKVRWYRDSCNFNVTLPGPAAEMEVIGNIYENEELL